MRWSIGCPSAFCRSRWPRHWRSLPGKPFFPVGTAEQENQEEHQQHHRYCYPDQGDSAALLRRGRSGYCIMFRGGSSAPCVLRGGSRAGHSCGLRSGRRLRAYRRLRGGSSFAVAGSAAPHQKPLQRGLLQREPPPPPPAQRRGSWFCPAGWSPCSSRHSRSSQPPKAGQKSWCRWPRQEAGVPARPVGPDTTGRPVRPEQPR